MVRCAIYCRVSTEEQAVNGLSIDAQKNELTEYAKKNNYAIVDYYIDEGKTARKSLKNRTELLRLLEDVKQDKIDIIIFTKLDRWFRNIRDYYKVQETLEKHNINWKTIKENYDTTTANGRLCINIMLSIAQDEADRTSERIKAVFDSKVKQGIKPTPSCPVGYKYVDKEVVIDEDKKDIALDIFNFYLFYNSKNRVLREILYKYNVSLCEQTIARALKNPLYTGYYKGSRVCDPLVSLETFEQVQGIIKKRAIPLQAGERPFLFGGLLFCGECNRAMRSNTQKRSYGKKVYVMYNCKAHAVRKICSNKKCFYENFVETYLVENIQGLLEKHITDYETALKKEKSVPKINISAIKNKMQKLLNLYMSDTIQEDIYKVEYEKLNKLMMEGLKEKQDLPQRIDANKYKDVLSANFKELYGDLNADEKRHFWHSIIDKIFCYPDKTLVVQFK